MFDMRKININDFKVTMSDGSVFTLNTPKLKTLKKIMALGKTMTQADNDNEEANLEQLEQLSEAVALALNNNKEKRKVSVDYVDENMTIEEIKVFILEYFNWVGTVLEQKN